MNHGSLFSGIGGFDLAAEWMGWENKFHCEWNPFGQKVLKHYWPEAESFNDITKTDFTPYANRIDILTGGFPCQPYSLAGKRKGKEDERHLWPEMLRAIREIQPRWVVGENVFGLINWNGGLVFDEVQTDLETAGYEVWPYVLPACAVNAPHRRDRVWFVAHSIGCSKRSPRTRGGIEEKRSNNNSQPKEWGNEAEQHIRRTDVQWNASNPKSQSSERMRFEQREFGKQKQGEFGGKSSEVGNRDASNTNSQQRSKGWLHTERPEQAERYAGACNARSHERTTWDKFPTQSPVCTGDDGLPSRLDGIAFSKWRNESIKAAGNAIVPQVALQIFKSIEQYEQKSK